MQHRNSSKKNVSKLTSNDEKSITSPILKEEAKYFTNIFSFQTTPALLDSCNNFFPGDYTFKLTDLQRDSCEGLIAENELKQAINSFKSGKTPGGDGYSSGV